MNNWIGFSIGGGYENKCLVRPLSSPSLTMTSEDTVLEKSWIKNIKLCLMVTTARISKSTITDRKDSNGNLWKGVKKIKIS